MSDANETKAVLERGCYYLTRGGRKAYISKDESPFSKVCEQLVGWVDGYSFGAHWYLDGRIYHGSSKDDNDIIGRWQDDFGGAVLEIDGKHFVLTPVERIDDAE